MQEWSQEHIDAIYRDKTVLAPLVGGYALGPHLIPSVPSLCPITPPLESLLLGFVSLEPPLTSDSHLYLVDSSELSYRLLARRYGAQLTYTEMNIAEYYNANHGGAEKRKLKSYEYEFDAADRPLILQLAGNTAEPIISLANRDMFKGHIDGVDLNCGCPQGFAMEKKIGAGLLRNPDNLVELATQISENIAYPFSMKLRLHEDGVETTMGLMDKLVERTKVKAFTLHGRFWWQKGDKRGIADWEAVRMVREHIPKRIPLIGNGDVTRYGDFERFKQMSGVDSVMVGYGALLDPTVFQPEPVPLETVLHDYLNIARRHHNGLVDVQRHIQWMTKRRTGGDIATKASIFQAQSLEDIQRVFAALPSAPLKFEIPTLAPTETDLIRYPKALDAMTPKEKRRHEERQQSNAAKLAKRMKNKETTDAEERHKLAPGAPALELASSAPVS